MRPFRLFWFFPWRVWLECLCRHRRDRWGRRAVREGAFVRIPFYSISHAMKWLTAPWIPSIIDGWKNARDLFLYIYRKKRWAEGKRGGVASPVGPRIL